VIRVAADPNLAQLIRSVLGDPRSEQVVQEEMLALAEKNLHQPGVLPALVEVFPRVRDTGIRHRLQDILVSVDTSRITDLSGFHDSLIAAFRQEKEREARALLLDRLGSALHQDTRLAPFFIEILAGPALSDDELAAATRALAGLPSVPEETAVLVMARAVNAPSPVQERALAIAEGCPRWGEPLARAMIPFLGPGIDPSLRLRILARLEKASPKTPEIVPVLAAMLRTDPDAGIRGMALELLGNLAGQDAGVLPAVLSAATNDADPGIRARAIALEKDLPDLPGEQLEALARLLVSDDAGGVRVQVIGLLKPHLPAPPVRAAMLAAYDNRPAVFADDEFGAFVDALAPFASRDPAVRNTLLESWSRLPRTAQRRKLLDSLLPRLRPAESASWSVTLFLRERNPELRGMLFSGLRGLSVAKNPDLARAFAAELRDPGSAFRLPCARALAGAPDAHPDVIPAIEDVLANDQDRELVRSCLDGYLKPGIARKFAILLAVIGNEALDIASRQACVDQAVKDGLSADGRARLADAVAAAGPGILRLSA